MEHAYFPMFVDISDKKILVVGGGKVAARRIRSLLLFTDEVTVLAPRLCGELNPLPKGVHWIAREYGEEHLPSADAAMGDGAALPESSAVGQDDAELMEVDAAPVEEVDAASVEEVDVAPVGEVDAALVGKDIVLAATNQREVNRRIFEDCRFLEACEGRKILVNCADDKSHCDFFFPAVIQSDEITVGVNSGGRNTKKVREVREKVEEALKNNMHVLL